MGQQAKFPTKQAAEAIRKPTIENARALLGNTQFKTGIKASVPGILEYAGVGVTAKATPGALKPYPAISTTTGLGVGLAAGYGFGYLAGNYLQQHGYSQWKQSLGSGVAGAVGGWGATWAARKLPEMRYPTSPSLAPPGLHKLRRRPPRLPLQRLRRRPPGLTAEQAAEKATGTAATQATEKAAGTAATKAAEKGGIQAVEGTAGKVLKFIGHTRVGAGVFGAAVAAVPDLYSAGKQAIKGDTAAAKNSLKGRR